MPSLGLPRDESRKTSARQTGPAPLRRRRPPAASSPSIRWRTAVNYLLIFITVVLVMDALIGDKGFMDTLRVRREWQGLARSVEELRAENVRLMEQVRLLRADPATLEGIARREHGMIRAGELLFILKDVKPAAH